MHRTEIKEGLIAKTRPPLGRFNEVIPDEEIPITGHLEDIQKPYSVKAPPLQP